MEACATAAADATGVPSEEEGEEGKEGERVRSFDFVPSEQIRFSPSVSL